MALVLTTAGLYPDGSNAIPAAHLDAGVANAGTVQALDATGSPDPVNGKTVWLSIGMSNTSQETGAFIQTANAYPGIHPSLVLVNGGVGGQTAVIQSTPTHPNYTPYWNTVADRLAIAGVTAQQVQVIWLKVANQAVTTPLPEYYDSLLTQTKRITHELKERFPNVRLCYVASRSYGGYASGTNPEPYAYWQGWVMKHLIEAQTNGDPELAFQGPDAVTVVGLGRLSVSRWHHTQKRWTYVGMSGGFPTRWPASFSRRTTKSGGSTAGLLLNRPHGLPVVPGGMQHRSGGS